MKSKSQMGTQLLHTHGSKRAQGEPFCQPPTFASTFHLSGEIDSANFQYGRFSNPSWESLESILADLEGGETIIFPSGMAAIASVLTSLTKSGDKVVVTQDGYFATKAYASEFLVPNNIEVCFVKTNDLLNFDYKGVKLVLAETPSNPLLDVVDIKALARKVHQAGGLLAIDNTTLTVLGQQPLALGADISLCADTKALNGHSDVLFGHVSTATTGLSDRIRLWRKLAGNIPSPMDSFLVQRGLATLDVRLERMASNALALANMLKQHPAVNWVRYPGLQSDPSYSLACDQMHNFGFIISFDLVTKEKAQAFLQADLIYEATSFGGVHTMAERRARWGTDDLPEGLIRLSVGCERIEDLLHSFKITLDNL